MANVHVWIIFLVSALIKGTASYSYCHTGPGLLDTYCEYGCCGHDDYFDDEYQYCCSRNVVGVTVGGTVGGLVLLTIVVTICICCYQKNRAVAGRVIQPVGYTGGPSVVVATTNQTSGGYAYGPGTQYPPLAQQFGTSSSFSQHPPPYTSGEAYPGAAGGKGSFQPQY